VEVTGAARLYRAASGGPQGYAALLRPAMVAYYPRLPFGFDDLGKSFRQHRPDGLLVSQEQAPFFVWAITNPFVAGSRSQSARLTPKQ
jgi:hypothetical protein